MDQNYSFIDCVLTFDFNVCYNPTRPLEKMRRPVFLQSKRKWVFNEELNARDFFIMKEGYIENHIPDIIISGRDLQYRDYLSKSFNEFKVAFQKSQSENKDKYAFSVSLNSQIKKLERVKARYERKVICFTPDENGVDYCEELPWHKDVKIIYGNLHDESDPRSSTNSGYVNFIVAQLIDSQYIITEELIDFLKVESQKMLEPEQEKIIKKDIKDENDTDIDEAQYVDEENKGFKMIKYNDDINQLVTLFYDLLNNGYITTQSINLERFILASFTDKDWKPLKQSTVHTILKPGREDKRAQDDKRFHIRKRQF